MRVFVDGRLTDSSQNVIGIVLTEQDKKNIANMAPCATVYSEYVPTGQGAGPGLIREFDPLDVQELLDLVKAEERQGPWQLNWWPKAPRS